MNFVRAQGRRRWPVALIWLLLAFACCAAVVYGVRVWKMPATVDVEVRMSSTISGKGQFFPLASTGYTEQTSIQFALRDDGVAYDYTAQLVGLVQPVFRLDPGSGPGSVVIHSIRMRNKHGDVRLDGPGLRDAVRPLNQLAFEGGGNGLAFRSEGPDPHLQVSVPADLLEGHREYRRRGAMIGLGGAATLVLLLWLARARLVAIAHTGDRSGSRRFFFAGLFVTLVLLGVLGAGCGGFCGLNGVRYGAGLLLAALTLAAIGAASLRLLDMERPGTTRLFLWIATGQLVLVLYVFGRSALQAVLPLPPLGAFELALLATAALAYLWSARPVRARQLAPLSAWLAIELALLAAICLVVADRELPRVVMLSSDPDTHAYLARQVELLGAIPWHGESRFGYPAGTAALGFIWAKLALLDVRNSVAALPLLQSFLAALLLGEALSVRTRSPSVRLVVMLTTIGLTAAGFLIPLYSNYSHMEGAGRQMAIATAAIVAAMLVSGGPTRGRDGKLALMVLASLFVLAVLNPISAVVPIILAVGWVVHCAIVHGRISWWLLAIVGLPILLLLDPYYFQMFTDYGSTNPKITVSDSMQVKSAQQVLAEWLDHHASNARRFLPGGWAMGPGQAIPMFGMLMATILALRLLLGSSVRVRISTVVTVGLIVLALLAAEGLFWALRDDRRFYLLAPYYAFSLGQLKILLVTGMAGGIILLGRARGLNPLKLLIPALLLILPVRLGMHETQRFVLDPRADYCGSMGCASPDDLAVMAEFARLIQSDGDEPSTLPRVLVPNSVHRTANEDWVFPVTGARALPFHDVPPIAFFYYQGDDDYTTDTYHTHVCRRFDREWLRSQGIGYIFLPSARDAACMEGMEQLPATEEIVVRSGNSYLLRLRAP
ncbi:hypothetical protein [Luteimonas sp. SDU101]|uniref:hypothetical protein n=1 Tax=unclassified Luteimonas TaxID=2629088 RepID=UPI003EB76C0A